MYISVILVLAYSIIVFSGLLFIEYRLHENIKAKAGVYFTALRILSAIVAGICISGVLQHYQILP